MDGGQAGIRKADVALRSFTHGRRRLLVPVGRSGAHLHAVGQIMRVCPRDSTEVLLLNVRPTLKIGIATRYTGAGRIADAQRDFGEDLMRTAMLVLDAGHMQYSSEVAFGPVVETILGYAYAKGCDAIVIGVEAEANPSSLSPASVAARALRLSGVPVAIVNDAGLVISARQVRVSTSRRCASED